MLILINILQFFYFFKQQLYKVFIKQAVHSRTESSCSSKLLHNKLIRRVVQKTTLRGFSILILKKILILKEGRHDSIMNGRILRDGVWNGGQLLEGDARRWEEGCVEG